MATYINIEIDKRLPQRMVFTDPDGTIVSLTGGVIPTSGIPTGTSIVVNGVTLSVLRSTLLNVAQSQTDMAVVAAVASKQIRVVGMYAMTGGTATNITFNTKPAGAGSAVSILFALGANGSIVLPLNPYGWWADTGVGEGLSVTSGAGSTTGIQVLYVTL